MHFVFNTTLTVPKKGISSSITNVIPKKWDFLKLKHFLTHLAVDENVVASTQNQALGALLFLYRETEGYITLWGLI